MFDFTDHKIKDTFDKLTESFGNSEIFGETFSNLWKSTTVTKEKGKDHDRLNVCMQYAIKDLINDHRSSSVVSYKKIQS